MRAAGVVLAVAVGMAGCLSVKPLVLDRQMEIEKQLLGRLSRLEAEVILASSVRGAPKERKGEGKVSAMPTVSPLRRELLRVQRDRAFRADDIDDIEDRGVAGEAKTGLLEIVAPPTEARARQRVEALVRVENADRERLFRAVIAIDVTLSSRDLPLLRRIFAKLRRSTARPGQKVQGDDGRWITVVAAAKRELSS
ncbi:MAG: DUF1318 domain-containing protein [Deltaproteobacteria bacterium]|nr:DUF1318 domain-containing protein [Deltaproteobacteria bacterium]